MNLKEEIYNEILSLNKDNVSIVSMKLFYIISKKILDINLNEKYNRSEDKIYGISSQCTDNIECLLNNHLINNIKKEELTDLIYKIIITNLKYI
jgi:hypothetical protein